MVRGAETAKLSLPLLVRYSTGIADSRWRSADDGRCFSETATRAGSLGRSGITGFGRVALLWPISRHPLSLENHRGAHGERRAVQ